MRSPPDQADLFLADLRAAVGVLNDAGDRVTASGPQAFHH